jgi:hypothetical protein
MRRPALQPSLDAAGIVLEAIVEHVRVWQADTLETIEKLRGCRMEVEEKQKHLESPQAALQFADFFADFFLRRAADFDRVLEQLEAGVISGQAEALAQIGAASAAEERRCLSFRDKWLNRPLPYEDVRPVLDRLSAAARDQLHDYRELRKAAAHIRPPEPPEPPGPEPDQGPDGGGGIDRRELFTRLFKR